MSADTESVAPEGDLIDGRYRVRRLLGRGGAAEVYEVLDEPSGRVLALKRFAPRRRGRRGVMPAALFEREYHSLSGLAHPRIIQVFDYGVSRGRPYYTMELLDGTDLRDRAPLGWQEACRFLRDVASSLALIHSRKLVHRDVTPRNVVVTSDGRAKLVDFGALAPMGRSRELVGTPPFVAPEAFHRQPIDGRADLFALGATAYWVLGGHHAFPAARLDDLLRLWKSAPPPLSKLVAEVPTELDALILSLLSLDPRARPRHAMEVSERLTAIASLPREDDAGISGAYLSVPAYVGQGRAHAAVQALFGAVSRGAGGTLVVLAPPGAGRSRFLDACVLQAKLAGFLPVSVPSADASPHAGLRALTEEVLTTAPELAREAMPPPGLADLVSGGSAGSEPPAPVPTRETANGARETTQLAREWLVRVSRSRPLVIVVDDVQLSPDATLALLAALARRATTERIAVIVSAPLGLRDDPSVRRFRETGSEVVLEPLAREETHALVESIFGNVPNVTALAETLHGRSAGTPGACLAFVRHLVEEGVVRFERGAWWLPERVDLGVVPSSVEAAFAARVDALTYSARLLALCLALAEVSLSPEDHEQILPDVSERFIAITQLLHLEIIEGLDSTYRLTHEALGRALVAAATGEERMAAHDRVARLLARRRECRMDTVHHLFEAGDAPRATELLLSTLAELEAGTLRFDVRWLRHLREDAERALSHCERAGRPPRDAFRVRQAMLLLSYLMDPLLAELHGPPMEAHLRHALGVVHWIEAGALPERERVSLGLRRARAAYEVTPEALRVLSPDDALEVLARYAGFVNNPYTLMLDNAALDRVIQLVRPFAFLSPLLQLNLVLLQASRNLNGQRSHVAERLFREALALLDQEGSSIRHRAMFRYGALFGLAQCRATFADPQILEWADELARHPLQLGNAWRMRRVFHLFAGNAARAQACAASVETLTIEQESVRTVEGGTVFIEMVATAMGGDLLQFGSVLERVAAMAQRYPGHAPTHAYALGMYEKLRGNLKAARAKLAAVLTTVGPGGHPIWPLAVDAQVEVLIGLGEASQALALASRAHEEAAAADVETSIRLGLEGVLALAEAELDRPAGKPRAQRVVAESEARGLAAGILATAYERAARVALRSGDFELCAMYAERFDAVAQQTENPVLLARSGALGLQSQRGGRPGSVPPPSSSNLQALIVTDYHSLMSVHGSSSDRARRALGLLANHVGALSGYLYRLEGQQLSLAATYSGDVPPSDLADRLGLSLGAITSSHEVATETLATVADSFAALPADGREPLVSILLARGRGDRPEMVGIAALRVLGNASCHIPEALMELVCELLESGGPGSAPASSSSFSTGR